MARMAKVKRQARPKTGKMNTYAFPVVIEHDEDGYFVTCPSLQGCYTQGDTYEEAMANITDAVKLHIADRIASKEPVPIPKDISITMLAVAA
jgi:predicted RNase H-like HicB family nuclease